MDFSKAFQDETKKQIDDPKKMTKQIAAGDVGGAFQTSIDSDVGSRAAQEVLKSDTSGLKANPGELAGPSNQALKTITPTNYAQGAQGQSAASAQAAKIAQVAGPSAAQMQAANINTNPQDQFRQQQLNLASQLSQQASGQGPSVANMQLQQGQAAALAASQAQLASARGAANPALARQVLQQGAASQQSINEQAGVQRLQEQMQAAGMLGNLTGQARGADIGLAQSQAEMQQQAALQNAQLQQQTGLAQYQGNLSTAQQQAGLEQQTNLANQQSQQTFQALQQKYAAMGLSAEQANQQAALEFEKMKQQGEQAQKSNELEAQKQNRNILGSAIGTVGAMFA